MRVQGLQKCESEIRKLGRKKEWILNWQECGCQKPPVVLTCMPQLIRMPDMLSRLGVKGNRFAPPYLQNCNSVVLRYVIH